MREIRGHVTDIDRHLEEALRAKQQLDAERWRTELRPRVLRLFAARARKLAWSRALLKLVVEALYPDDLFAELVGRLDRVPRRQWPYVIAIAVALRHSWRRDGLTRVAKTPPRVACHEPASPPRFDCSPFPTITSPILRLASVPSRLSAAFRPRAAGLTALTGLSVEPGGGIYVMAGID
jgi:hypothetical protein